MPIESEGVDDFKPTRDELEVLARHYVNIVREIELCWMVYQYTGSYSRWREFLVRGRLRTIEDALGKERFQEAVASIYERWDREIAKLEEEERNLEPCNRCRAKRTLAEDRFFPDGHCHACDPAMAQSDDRSDLSQAN